MTAIALPQGYELRRFDRIDSTNEEAKRLAKAGTAGPIWILAREQTLGRGRRGRAWHSPPGNLMATLFFRPAVSAAKGGELSFVAALAVADSISTFAPGVALRLKWPNDVLLAERKVAGILLESASPAGSPALDWLAIGIGINLAHSPADLPEGALPATSLAAVVGAPPEPEVALQELAKAWARRYGDWHGAGFAPTRRDWLARAGGLGARIVVRLPAETIEGVFEGLDDSGALELRLASGLTRRIAAGEVFYPVTS
jgi:BirA family biotin operon repressor/biotin-[acetyl-CoA-carboxylase] ligase